MTTPDDAAQEMTQAASQLARTNEPPQDEARLLYALAATLSALTSPVGRIGGTHHPETQAAVDALRAAERALHALQHAHTRRSGGKADP